MAATMDNESATTQNMIWHLTYHIVGACLGSCMKRCLRCLTLIRSESTRFVASWSKLIALPGLREYTPWTHGTRNCPHSHHLYTRRHSECPDGAQRIADINMTVSADVIPDAFNAIPRRWLCTRQPCRCLVVYTTTVGTVSFCKRFIMLLPTRIIV